MAPAGRRVSCLVVALAACALLAPGCARQPPPRPPPPPSLIAVGAVDCAVAEVDPPVLEELRERLEAAAETLGRDRRLRRRLVLDGSVAAFERARESRRLTLRCEVTLSIRDAADGRLLAMPRGWVESSGDAPRDAVEAEALDREAVRDAVANALSRLEPVLFDL